MSDIVIILLSLCFIIIQCELSTNISAWGQRQFIVLVGIPGRIAFPVEGYGGTTIAVEQLAWGLSTNNIDFVVIACVNPKHDLVFPFKIFDIPYTLNVEQFYGKSIEIIKNLDRTPNIIWAHGIHASTLLVNTSDVPMIVTYADSGPPMSSNITLHNHVFHRFLSHNQHIRWTFPPHTALESCSFPLSYGFADYEFIDPSSFPRGYDITFLSAHYNQYIKGVDHFCELARLNPQESFVVYGLSQIICEDIPINLSIRGEVPRGILHTEMMKSSKVFVILQRWDEAFGRVVVEAAGKGVPVLGACDGSLPELLRDVRLGAQESIGITAQRMDGWHQALQYLKSDAVDRNSIFEAARSRFHVDKEIRGLLLASRIMTEVSEPSLRAVLLKQQFGDERESSLLWGKRCFFPNDVDENSLIQKIVEVNLKSEL